MQLRENFIQKSIENVEFWLEFRKIKNIEEYDPTKVRDAVLGDDWRAVCYYRYNAKRTS